ncbi:hypothetical protein L7F22_047357 [Adiantum nelumboides]|nr:hypothetical protein [Adiantum nelumboides]
MAALHANSCKRSHVNGAGVLLLLATAILCMGMDVESRDCPAAGFVYPLYSTCFHPAVYYGQEVYELGDAGLLGNLAPEWDESNSTYYVRLAEDGAKYLFTHSTFEYRFAVSQSQRLVIRNAETGRFLGWRQEGDDEYFLVELELETSAADYFMFSKEENVTLPCVRIANARCEAYYILSFEDESVGLTAYVEDEVTYFTRSNASAAAPFVLFRSDIASTKPTAFSSHRPQAITKDILPIV